MHLRRGQAMLESVIAVLFVTALFFTLFKLERMLTGKILLQHAAMRVARARAVGFNEAVCRRTARAAVIPVAGRRTWPEEALSPAAERARVAIYLGALDDSIAARVLDYEGWDDLTLGRGDETASTVRLRDDWFDLEGEAGVERHAAFYLNGGR